MYSLKGRHNNKNHAFASKRSTSNEKNLLLLHILQ